MAGIYIHIPFCSSFCTYCDFYSVVNKEKIEAYLIALNHEIIYRKDFFKRCSTRPTTIYFGGGTPSLLSIEDLSLIFNSLRQYFDLSAVEEITVEVNPDDVSLEYALGLASLGVNRVSMGIQSFDDGVLRWMNRRHSARDAEAAFMALRQAGIQNISLDLIFGHSPDMGLLVRDVEKLISLGAEHISAYQLGIEEGTALFRQLEEGKYVELEPEDCQRQYSYVQSALSEAGYEQYEISNFSKPGFRSKHNSAYWDRVPYLGLGASAHSFWEDVYRRDDVGDGVKDNCGRRSWNIADLDPYMEVWGDFDGNLLVQPRMVEEVESLSEENVVDEMVMVGLRKVGGFCLDDLPQSPSKDDLIRRIDELRLKGLVTTDVRILDAADMVSDTLLILDTATNNLRIPLGKLFISDYVISLLF